MQKCDHGPEEQEVEKRETKSKMKNLAETSCLTYRQIYDENVSSPKAKLQPFSEINSTLEKRRKKVLPLVPQNFESFKAALNGDQRKIHDLKFYRETIKAGKEFAILFAADMDAITTEKVEEIHADRTFKVVPFEFYQLLIVHCVIYDTLDPVLYAQMTAKCRTLYDAVFCYIRNMYTGFKLELCIVDFETALHSSIQFTFECRMQGCYFYYRQAL